MSRSGEFLPRLWCMLNEPRLASIITWSADSTTVCLLDKDLFEKFVLPYVYKAKKLSSFYRQLRIYGFKRTTSVKDDAVNFKHREFSRNTSINVLYNIERHEYSERNKRKNEITAISAHAPSEANISSAPPHLPYMTAPSTTTFISKVTIGGYATSYQTPLAGTASTTLHAPVPISPTEYSPILNEDFEVYDDVTIHREI
ncbi:winged helix DNA-binding domain-containing protein [Wallemia mellicola]|uniref:Winged helix DNA-binding domain-containing protein n=2 Tax=Wallemia mellicola TaxID=1708541 RepID=A0A4T0R4F0_9BASI|nr:winged helix DNA-binding domain-containing protein [Wallemia mellicola]TIC32011.1 winged helix DNA-binding domain-containing protein [Wallemia mellicola]